MFGKTEDIEMDDMLIVFDNENRTSDIQYITSIDNEAINVEGLYKVPLEDCEITTGTEGRHFFYKAPAQSINETKRLARLEIDTVLRQITAYKEPIPPSSLDWTKGILFGLIFILILVIAFS